MNPLGPCVGDADHGPSFAFRGRKGTITVDKTRPILIVEDDEDVRESLKQVLELLGYPVYLAKTGKVALELLKSIPNLGLILLDLMMPEMNGEDFLLEQKRSKTWADVPVLVISALGAQYRALANRYGTEAAKPANSAGFLQKPIHLDKLLRKIQHYCGGSIPTSAAAA